ncbi:MAG: T9SS type A sorting domain-containing protein [Candidatus Krumholzibacteriota bacterium]|nr:T9SS type A sorting domain-containing protein [Candidatus Krumholzibacteriota bacterium]
MKRRGILIILISVLTAGRAVSAPGDWSLFLDASAVNRITCIGDSLWCGTYGGILLFDLTDSTLTQFYSGLELRSNDISAVTVDRELSVWIAYRGEGIARIDDLGIDPEVTHYNENTVLILSDSVNCLLSVDEDVYYGCDNGIAKFFDKTHSLEPNLSENLRGKRVNDLLVDDNNILWIAYEDGVAEFDRDTYVLDLHPIGYSFSMTLYEGMIYCAVSTGIMRFDGDSWEEFGTTFHNELVPLCIASGGGGIYAVTAERAYRYNGLYWESLEAAQMKSVFNEDYRINQFHLNALAVDDRGTPWIGGRLPSGTSRGSYISGFVGSRWINRAVSNLSQNNVIELDIAPAGGVWASTMFGVNYRSLAGEWINYKEIRSDVGSDDALSYFAYNLAMICDSQNHLWCNSQTYDLDMIDLGNIMDKGDDIWEHFAVEDENTITTDRFVKAKEDPGGNRWFMSDDDYYQSDGMWGINIINAAGSEWLEVNPFTIPEMKGGNIFDCAFGQYGVYIAIQGYGVQYWRTGGFGWSTLTSGDGDFWTTLMDDSDLLSTEIEAIELGDDGSVWVGTAAGLVRYESGTLELYKEKDENNHHGIIGLSVRDLEFDNYGNLWVATNKGLNRIDPDGVIDRAYTTATFWEDYVQPYYPESVISPLPSHLCEVLAFDPDESFLWIGTDRGLARFDVRPPVEPDISLSKMILYPNPVHLDRGDASLKISRISGKVDIRIYNLEGELVHEIDGVSEGEDAWDLLTINGFTAQSGIYIVRVFGGGKTELRKVAVIR